MFVSIISNKSLPIDLTLQHEWSYKLDNSRQSASKEHVHTTAAIGRAHPTLVVVSQLKYKFYGKKNVIPDNDYKSNNKIPAF